jgi:hypothetical protein
MHCPTYSKQHASVIIEAKQNILRDKILHQLRCCVYFFSESLLEVYLKQPKKICKWCKKAS